MRGIRGASHAPSDWWEHTVRAHGDMIPPFPGPSVLAALQIPSPPAVDAEASPGEIVRLLLDSYVVATYKSYGFCLVQKRKIDLEYMRGDGKKLLACAKKMLGLNILPLAWCMSSIDFYEEYVPRRARRRQAPLFWVYSLKRLEERTDFYSKYEATYKGGQVSLASAHRGLIDAWRSMERKLYKIAATGQYPNREQVQYITDEYRTQFTFYLATARREYGKMHARLNKRLAAGEYVW